MKLKRLISTIDLPKDEWLKIRASAGITGSEISSILGVNKWKSAMSVYLEKIGEVNGEIEDNDRLIFGRLVEGVIADEFNRRNPEYKVKKINAILQHPQYDWVIGDIDRLITNEKGEHGVLEIKTVSEFIKDQWEDEEVPASYLCQLQWYLFLTGCQYGLFAALIGGNKYIQKFVERDDELIQIMFERAKDFWENNVLTKNPPIVDGSEASSNVLAVMYPEAAPGTEIDLDTEAEALCEQREALKQQEKELETQINEIDNRLKQKLGECELGMTEHYKVKWSNIVKNTFDSKKLKTEHEDIYNKYLKPSTYRKLDIRPVKKMEA